jgi:hypothetical protein
MNVFLDPAAVVGLVTIINALANGLALVITTYYAARNGSVGKRPTKIPTPPHIHPRGGASQ